MKARVFDAEHGTVCINCPGCKTQHYLNVDPKNGRPCWGFNNDFEKPTFTPSLLVRTGKYVPPDDTWYKSLTAEQKENVDRHSAICHSFIKEGMIQFLSDCTHSMANQTVPLLELETRNP
jgi:hypothetical protein